MVEWYGMCAYLSQVIYYKTLKGHHWDFYCLNMELEVYWKTAYGRNESSE